MSNGMLDQMLLAEMPGLAAVARRIDEDAATIQRLTDGIAAAVGTIRPFHRRSPLPLFGGHITCICGGVWPCAQAAALNDLEALL